jgi:hypothetical protein
VYESKLSMNDVSQLNSLKPYDCNYID